MLPPDKLGMGKSSEDDLLFFPFLEEIGLMPFCAEGEESLDRNSFTNVTMSTITQKMAKSTYKKVQLLEVLAEEASYSPWID